MAQRRLDGTKLKSPNPTQRHAYLNAPKSHLERRKRKRRRKARKKSARKVSAQAANAAAMTAEILKTSRREKGLKVGTKTRKLQKPGGETRTAARRTAMMRRKGRDGLTKSENTTPRKTQTRGQTLKRRGEKTGRQQARGARMIVLQTEMTGMNRHIAQVMTRKTTTGSFVHINTVEGFSLQGGSILYFV